MTNLNPLENASIQAIAQYIQQQVAENWATTLERNAAKLEAAYASGGDMAYGTYLVLLFRPINRAIKAAGLTLEPALPGDLDLSREWGNGIDETQQQRWMWSMVYRDGEPLGAMVVVVFHDHSGFKVTRVPNVIALEQNSNDTVIEALSREHIAFANAQPFTVEVAEYWASLEPVSSQVEP
jgi:hypothetical protein